MVLLVDTKFSKAGAAFSYRALIGRTITYYLMSTFLLTRTYCYTFAASWRPSYHNASIVYHTYTRPRIRRPAVPKNVNVCGAECLELSFHEKIKY